jgi:GNAT superfamily N-acetyltransferase
VLPEPPGLLIRGIDPYDEAEMRAFQDVYVAAERAELPDAAVYSLADAISIFTQPASGRFYNGYAAFQDGRLVGEGILSGSTIDNLATAHTWVWVHPDSWGHGVGSALVDHLVEQARSLGRRVLQSGARYRGDQRRDHPYRRFAERHGFQLANTEIERRLRLPVPAERLDALAQQAWSHADGYHLQVVVGPIPMTVAQDYCDVLNRLAVDAPTGDLVVERGRRTPDHVADQDRELEAAHRTRLTVLGLDGRGAVVAVTSAVATEPGYPHIDQWATIVAPEHRGHRLGLAVKIEQTRALQETFPDKEFVSTTNAETNDHMIAINQALGYELYSLSVEFQRILPGYDAVGVR